MFFYSTNSNLENGFKEKVDFKTALFLGQAPDEGLFMPETIPDISKELDSFRDLSYAQLAVKVLMPYLEGLISEKELLEITKEAYNFEIPIDHISDNLLIARMDAGPTASFKDFAAQLMSRLMYKFKPREEIKILVATSGDTGSAIGEAFKGLEGIKVFILFPKNEVSTIQRKQLTTVGKNVLAIELDGKFDDCQHFVKQAFSDPDLKSVNLSSANSINIGRLLPQIVYYFYIYLQVAQKEEEVNFCIPTGNLGNAMGCILAKKMGLPVNKVIIATNSNDAIPKWLKTDTYEKISPSINNISNAMNVGNPSNLVRLFDLHGGSMDKNGTIHRSITDKKGLKSILESFSVSDSETVQKMKDFYHTHHVLLEPHGAVGVKAVEKYLESHTEDVHKTIVLETAHPAKFPEVISKELGLSSAMPSNLQHIISKEEQFISIANNYQAFKNILIQK
jgi:threonine synthase